MSTTVQITFDLPKLALELGHVDDVHSLVSDAVTSIARRLENGDTAGEVVVSHYDSELELWEEVDVATFEVVDEDGEAVTSLHEVLA